ncbi:MAG: hypothetical protein ACLUVC_10300 [Longibaculum sp.]
MNNKEIIKQIEILCTSLSKKNYDESIQKGYSLLKEWHHLGYKKDDVYDILHQYYQNLDDELTSDFIADLMDFIVGWCSPQVRIWKD